MDYTYKFFKTLVLTAILLLPLSSWAVTQKEMEQARTIAAKAYLRYANDGSGYLDDLNPKTMTELEEALKPKEKENIKAFKAIAVPSDYKDWTKEKLVEYWAVTAFQDKGLLEKGRGGRIRARSQINKMTIAPPQQEAAPAATPTTPGASQASSPQVANDSITLAEIGKAENALLEDEEADDFGANVDKATNYTWVYIMVLAILVAIVIALVVYAANVMKKTGPRNTMEGRHHSNEHQEELEHYESLLSDKDVEIAMLNKKIESLTRQNSEMKEKIEKLSSELSAPRQHSQFVSNDTLKKEESSPATKTTLRSIFLGRANIRGIFVRADRSLNIGHSIFTLETSDGYSGTFKVADSPAAWSLALSNPAEYLETACTGHDLNDTSGVSRIVTESSGTAVFEGGCWKVIRKARIRYE